MKIIQTHSLTKKFRDLTAVDSIDIEVYEGEVFGLLGPNGAGKTTTIKMLTTLFAPTKGTAQVDGFDIIKQQNGVRRSIGYVPQMISLDQNLTAFENLLIFAKLYSVPTTTRKARIEEAIGFMGLSDFTNKIVKTFSGGMIRRLEIAQSLLHRPKILFLDEPTVGLDPVARASMWGHIEKLNKDYGTTVFLTTHYMEEADKLCDRLSIMHKGKVAVTGTPQDLKNSIQIENANLDMVFAHYTGGALDNGGGSFKDTQRSRRVARRLG